MQQFTVPQFIDVEDKIIGPITIRQFIIMLAAGFLVFIFFKILAFVWFIIFTVLTVLVGGTIAFVRINGQPFHFFLLNILQTWRSPNLQIWDKAVSNADLQARIKSPPAPLKPPAPRKEAVSSSRLSEIALIVDTGGVYTPEA